MATRFHLHEKVVGPLGHGEIVRIQHHNHRMEYLVRYDGGAGRVTTGHDLRHTFRALHPGMIGGSCANCYAPAGMHDEHQACREVDSPVITEQERRLLEIAADVLKQGRQNTEHPQ